MSIFSIGVSARPMVAFSGFIFKKAMNILHQAMRALLYWRTATAIEMVSKVSTLYHRCSVDCRPDGRRGNTVQ